MLAQDTIKKLTEKSERVLDGFRKALQDYRDINNKLEVETNEIDKQLMKLNGERVNAVNLREQNEKFINKLNNFLN
jgi:hypothetical protein